MTKASFLTGSLNTLVGLVVGTAGGALFYFLHAPLPWTLGPLFFTAVMALCGGTWFLPRFAWSIARPLVGVLAGAAFTLPVVMSLLDWWDTILALVIYSVTVTFIGWMFFRNVAKYDDITSFFASAPGGLGELTLLGGTLGGSVRTLVLIHAVRIVLMVFTVPIAVQLFLLPEGASIRTIASNAGALSLTDWAVLSACGIVGFFLGRPLRTFGGVMLIPMILSAAVHIAGITHASPPAWIVAGMQVLIGSITGSRFAGITLAEMRSMAGYAVAWAIFLLVTAMFAAWVCSLFMDEPLLALVLAFTPGGIVEITVIAYALGLHVAFIVTTQLCRVTLVLLTTPTLFKLLPNPRLPGEPDDTPPPPKADKPEAK